MRYAISLVTVSEICLMQLYTTQEMVEERYC